MRTPFSLLLAGLACGLAFVLMPADAAEDRERGDELISAVYPIAHLPVWMHQSDDFDPTLLIDYLKLAVDPASWERGAITAHPRTSSLVIRQTRANHRKIQDILATFRRDLPGEQRQEVDEGSTSRKWVAPIGTAYDVAEGQDRGQSTPISRIGGDFIFHLGETCDRPKNSAGIITLPRNLPVSADADR